MVYEVKHRTDECVWPCAAWLGLKHFFQRRFIETVHVLRKHQKEMEFLSFAYF